jgi:hypothetical protein
MSKRSRKQTRRAAPVDVDWLDAMHERCLALETVGGLLLAATEREGAESPRPELVAGAGALVLREVEAVRALADAAGKAAR